MVAIPSMNTFSSEPQSTVQNTNTDQKTSDDNIWSKYDDNKDGVINLGDTSSVKPKYDQVMQKVSTLSEKAKSYFQGIIYHTFQKGISYKPTAEEVKIADNDFESSTQNLEKRIDLAIELNDIQPEKIELHKKDSSVARVKKNGESIVIVPEKDGKYIVFRQNSQPLPANKKERKEYSEIEHKEYNSFDELKEDIASESYGWGRTTLLQNHPDTRTKQDLQLFYFKVNDFLVSYTGYNEFEKK